MNAAQTAIILALAIQPLAGEAEGSLCHVDPKSLEDTTIELVSNRAPFTQRIFRKDGTYAFYAHGISSSGTWHAKDKEVCTSANGYAACGTFSLSKSGEIYVSHTSGTTARYIQRTGAKIKCL